MASKKEPRTPVPPNGVTKALRSLRLNQWYECKGLADRAASENRYFSAEEQGTWDVLNEYMDDLDKRIKSALDAGLRAHRMELTFTRLRETGGKSEVVNALRDRRQNVWDEVQSIAEEAAEECRFFSGEEDGDWQVMFEELQTLDERIDSALLAACRAAEADRTFRAITSREGGGGIEVVAALRDRRFSIWSEIKGMADRAGAEQRVFTPAEQGIWDVTQEELDALEARIRDRLKAVRDG